VLLHSFWEAECKNWPSGTRRRLARWLPLWNEALGGDSHHSCGRGDCRSGSGDGHLLGFGLEQLHGVPAEVAAVGVIPFVMLLDQDVP